LVTRYGGDAFAVLLPGIEKEGATRVAEKLRSIVATHNFSTIDGSGELTVSIALTCTSADGKEKILERLESTVNGLYAAGGNRVSEIRR
jgi:diguanylate cyclase (GGDEF)-like protein